MMRVVATCSKYGVQNELERQLLRTTVISCSHPTCMLGMLGDMEISSATLSLAQ